MNPSRMRLQVLQRDRYRCRGCNRTGDEITLEVRQIRPGATGVDEMVTLCTPCRHLVEQWNIAASSGPEFLLQLWNHAGRWQQGDAPKLIFAAYVRSEFPGS